MDCKLKLPVVLPTKVFAVPVVLILVVPRMVVPPFKLARPVTPSRPPKLVAPVPTLKLFDPVTLVAPFKLTAPVAVLKLPAPAWAKLPLVWE